MGARPETRYADSDGLSIAYQVWGSGPPDVVLTPGLNSHLEALHDLPGYTEWLESLAAFCRLVVFDKRGNGMSDRIAGIPTLEARIRDIACVMDAAGLERAALIGLSEGAPMSILFSATLPERVDRLVLAGGFAAGRVVLGQRSEAEHGEITERIRRTWGTGEDFWLYELVAPSLQDSAPEVKAAYQKLNRLSATPSTAATLWDMAARIDVRSVLRLVRTPTLVVHRADEAAAPLSAPLLAGLPDAHHVVVAGVDHLPWVGDQRSYATAIRRFLTKGVEVPSPPMDRVLATVLFTDLVASTEREAELGDTAFRRLLDRHDELTHRQVVRFGGRRVKCTGDGLLAVFDAPTRAIRCALALREGVQSLDLAVRAGLHTGEIELRGDDVSGISVNIASRLAGCAKAGEIVVSDITRQLVLGSDLSFAEREAVTLKGLQGRWAIACVRDE